MIESRTSATLLLAVGASPLVPTTTSAKIKSGLALSIVSGSSAFGDIRTGLGEMSRDLLGGAARALPSLRDRSVREQVATALPRLAKALQPFVVDALPSLELIELEDGSAVLQWALPRGRFALTFEIDPFQSGWLFVPPMSSGQHATYGSSLEVTELGAALRLALGQS